MKNTTIRIFRFLLTAGVFALALVISLTLWNHYMYRPWTRDGRVRAEVIKVASDVPGLVEQVCVKDNQRVKKGDLLMVIDSERYRFAVDQAAAQVASLKAELENHRRDAARRERISDNASPVEEKEKVRTLVATAQAKLDDAQSRLNLAKLNLRRTEIRSTVNGYVSNLNVYVGDYALVGAPKMAVVDADSFWVYGYFEETKIPALKVGDPAVIELMSGGPALRGHIESIARGITDRDNPAGGELLSNVNPTFSWVRLAMRVPVRVRIDEMPAGTLISAGMTCTVDILPGAPVPAK